MYILEKSEVLYDKACKVTPGGIHSNIRFFSPNPIFFRQASGSKMTDVDGNEYIDCVVNMGACILGHGHPKVTEAVREQIANGLTCGVETELSVNVAEKLSRMIPSAENVRFSNTGTEAVMKSLMMARAYTGRDGIVKIEGGYNGWHDCIAVSHFPDLKLAGPNLAPNPVPDTGGIIEAAWKKTEVIPFNNAEVAERAIKKCRSGVAALIVEPVLFNLGCVKPNKDYLKTLREITEDNDVLLIFDEVISGFRMSPGGGQEYYGVTPDVSTFGKAVANGFPLSLVAGRSDIVKVTQPGGDVAYGGLYNGNQPSLAAAEATLEVLENGHIQRYLEKATDQLIRNFSEVAEDLKVDARMQGLAGQFQVYFTDHDVFDYRTAAKVDFGKFKIFQDGLLSRKIYTLPLPLFHHGISASHTNEDLTEILKAMEESLETDRPALS